MYYVIHNNPSLLHQTNDVTSKGYDELMFRDIVFRFSSLFSPCLAQKTYVLFKYEKKVAI